MKILVTGGAGFVGSSLIDHLIKDKKNHVVALDNFLTGKRSNLPAPQKNFTFVKGDVNNYKDIASIMTKGKFDFVFHYAAVVGVERTLEHPTMVLDDIDGIRNILNLSKKTGVKRVLYSSSSEVYGEPVETPQNESTTPLNSKLPYAIVKNLGEAYLRSYQEEYGLDYTIFRFFNTYGPKQASDFVVSIFIDKALAGEPLPVIGKGNQTRTFCYIDDNVAATTAALTNKKAVNETFNIGSDGEITMLKLAKLIIKLTNSKSKIKFLPARVRGDMQRRMPDNKKMKLLLKRKLITLENGLKQLIKYKIEHRLK